MTSSDIVMVAPAEARELALRVLQALGTGADAAAVVAGSLVSAQLAGHDSHGIVRLREYASFVDRGLAVPSASPEVVRASGAVRVIDGNRCWGQLACRLAVQEAESVAQSQGCAVVTIRNANHVGRIGEYVEQLADAGLVGMLWCNADPCVAPFGGVERMLGTNPFAAGVPTHGAPVVVDFATAAIAEGKVRVARATGADVSPGAIIDRDGRESTNPNAFYEGGALLPFGQHKGYALSLLIELLGGGLSGGHPSVTDRYVWGNGVVLIAMDPSFFVDPKDFLDDTTDAVRIITASRPADPLRPVMAPGDLERAWADEREQALPIAAAIWNDITALLEERTA